jgi:hypothetical protein
MNKLMILAVLLLPLQMVMASPAQNADAPEKKQNDKSYSPGVSFDDKESAEKFASEFAKNLENHLNTSCSYEMLAISGETPVYYPEISCNKPIPTDDIARIASPFHTTNTKLIDLMLYTLIPNLRDYLLKDKRAPRILAPYYYKTKFPQARPNTIYLLVIYEKNAYAWDLDNFPRLHQVFSEELSPNLLIDEINSRQKTNNKAVFLEISGKHESRLYYLGEPKPYLPNITFKTMDEALRFGTEFAKNLEKYLKTNCYSKQEVRHGTFYKVKIGCKKTIPLPLILENSFSIPENNEIIELTNSLLPNIKKHYKSKENGPVILTHVWKGNTLVFFIIGNDKNAIKEDLTAKRIEHMESDDLQDLIESVKTRIRQTRQSEKDKILWVSFISVKTTNPTRLIYYDAKIYFIAD